MCYKLQIVVSHEEAPSFFLLTNKLPKLYVLLTVLLCINLQIKPIWCTNLLLVYLTTSTCSGRLCAHHQEKQLCFCDTWYLLSCEDDCLVRRVHPAYQTVIQNNKYQVSQKHNCFSWWWAHSRPEHVETVKYTENKFVHQISFIYKTNCPLYYRGEYLNVNVWFIEDVLLEQKNTMKKAALWGTYDISYAACLKKSVSIFVAYIYIYMKRIYRCVFLRAFSFGHAVI